MRLARLQQILTLGAVILAALWALGWMQQGRAGLALAGVATVLGGHAFVLALEFLLMLATRGSDPSPRPRLAQVLGAWWGEVLHAPRVFCWRQPFCHAAEPDHLPSVETHPTSPASRPRRGVLLVHGYVCNRGLWNPWLRRLRAQGVPVVAVTMEPPFGSIDAGLPTIEAAVQRLQACTGLPPIAVAHSMGGLAVRRWWAQPGNGPRLHRAITLGTPHHGTWLARWGSTPNAREMRQASPWLQTLAAAEPPGRAERITCFYSHCDNIVFPASTATLAGADNRHLPGVAHVHMVDHPAPWLALQQALAQPTDAAA